METALLREALDRDLPVLAICRGLQLLNAALGGALVQHIEEHLCPQQEAVRTPAREASLLRGPGRAVLERFATDCLLP
jgi:gamma-glutamyl-gamma-aminobutyrate hydrolase PuuD